MANLCIDPLADFNSTMADSDSTINCKDTDMNSVGDGPAPFHPKTHWNQTQTTLTPPIILHCKSNAFNIRYMYLGQCPRIQGEGSHLIIFLLTSLNFNTAAFLLSTAADLYSSAFNGEQRATYRMYTYVHVRHLTEMGKAQ